MKKYTIAEVYRRAQVLVASKEKFVTHGWVRIHRQAGSGLLFIKISDGTTAKELQCVYQGTVAKASYQSAVRVTGKLVDSPAPEQPHEILAESIEVIGECPSDFPLPRKQLPLPLLRQYPELRLRKETIQAVMRIRSTLAQFIHDFFRKRDYIYLHTPILTASDCEGAGEVFTVSAPHPDFFAQSRYLTVSGQLQGEAGACAMSRIYTFGPTFRAEKSDTARHLAEFWMIEPEMAFCDAAEAIQSAEELIRECVHHVLDTCHRELEILARADPGVFERLRALDDFQEITYTQAVELLEKAPIEHAPKWGEDLSTPHEGYLLEHFKKPVVVRDYPKSFKAFYMHQQPDAKTVACFDILLPGIGEVVGGSQREIRYDLLVKTMQERGMDVAKYGAYLDLRRYGSVPHSGYGLGFDRLVRFCTGIEHIRDVVPWPVSYKD